MSSITPPPTGGGNFKYVIVVILLLGGIAGLLVWKMGSNPPPTGPVVLRPFDAAVPPPVNRHPEDDVPPPPEIPDAGPDTGPVKLVANGGPVNYCNVTKCGGAASPELESALAFRAKQAHSCYDTALASDVSLKGRVSIAVRVAANGQVCTASVASNELGNPSVAQCVANKFRQTGYFPTPKGGCIDVTIPINFTPGGK